MAYEIKHYSLCSQRLIELSLPSTPTLLLVSGGSAMVVLEEFAKIIKTSLHHLTIAFVDERFDPINSNYALLLQKFPEVIYKTKELGAIWIDTRPQKKDQYVMADWYEKELSAFSYQRSVVLLGMGKDGHIAGIFPDEEKVFTERFVNTNRMVVGYDAKNEFPKRFTLTVPGLMKLDHILAYITREEKKEALIHALHENPPLHESPAVFFKQTRQKCEIFTDLHVVP